MWPWPNQYLICRSYADPIKHVIITNPGIKLLITNQHENQNSLINAIFVLKKCVSKVESLLVLVQEVLPKANLKTRLKIAYLSTKHFFAFILLDKTFNNNGKYMYDLPQDIHGREIVGSKVNTGCLGKVSEHVQRLSL